jgi:transposase
VTSQKKYGLTLLGPVPADTSWQAQAATGFDVAQFLVDWQQQKVTCPAGKTSRCWACTHDRHGKEAIHIKFAPTDCRVCPDRPLCTQAKSGGRMLTLRPQSQQALALRQARERQQTPDFKATYAKRAGIEGTISQGVHSFDLRRSRYIGLAKTRLQHVLIAASLDIVRIGAWLMERPRAQTRISRFGRLAHPHEKSDIALS